MCAKIRNKGRMIANLVVNARSQLARVLPDAVNRAAAWISLICFLNINANESRGVETVTLLLRLLPPFTLLMVFNADAKET